MPENKPIYKDSGMWAIYEEDLKTLIVQQEYGETLKQFICRYLNKLMSEGEQHVTEDILWKLSMKE